MNREIPFTEAAIADITAALDYLEERSPPAAQRLSDDIDARCELLAAQPGIGRSREDLIPGLRSSVIGSYLLFYRSNDAYLEIVRFLHGACDYSSELLDNE